METKEQILWEEISTGPSDRIVWDAPKIVQGEYLGAETQPRDHDP